MGSYEHWRQLGYPVGSGMIERAVALVIKRIIPKGGHEKAITVREMAMCKRKHGMLYSSLPARA